MTGMIDGFFWGGGAGEGGRGLKFSISGFFGVGKFRQVFFR